jgi:hypothetical protein
MSNKLIRLVPCILMVGLLGATCSCASSSGGDPSSAKDEGRTFCQDHFGQKIEGVKGQFISEKSIKCTITLPDSQLQELYAKNSRRFKDTPAGAGPAPEAERKKFRDQWDRDIEKYIRTVKCPLEWKAMPSWDRKYVICESPEFKIDSNSDSEHQ